MSLCHNLLRLTLSSVLLCGVAACSGPPLLLAGGEIEQGEQAIVNGTPETGHRAVGLLVVRYPGAGNAFYLCTATLAGRSTLLTAAHCLEQQGGEPSSVAFWIDGQFKGGTLSGNEQLAASWMRHPAYGGGNEPADVALVRLAQPVAGVMPMRLAPHPTYVGEAVTLVGYGKTSMTADDAGVKRLAHNTVEQVQAYQFSYKGAVGGEGITCSGDSGSSVIARRGGQDVIIGIHATGTCAQGDPLPDITAHAMRGDVYYGWIEQQAAGDLYQGGPLDVTPPTVAIGAPADQAQVAPDLDVVVQASDDSGVKWVRLYVDDQLVGQRSKPPFSFHLTQYPPGQHQLRAEAQDHAGYTAEARATVQITALKPLGAPCATDGECAGGRCVVGQDGGRCARTCSSTGPCPQGQLCQQGVCVQGPAGPAGGTVPGGAELGQPCDAPADCSGGLCATDPLTDSSYCSVRCDPATPQCPVGSSCVPTASTALCLLRHESAPSAQRSGPVLQQGACNLAGPGAAGLQAPWAAALLLLGLALLGGRRRRG